jgi:hypothetical protein
MRKAKVLSEEQKEQLQKEFEQHRLLVARAIELGMKEYEANLSTDYSLSRFIADHHGD